MTKQPPAILVFRRGQPPLAVTGRFRRSAAYRQYRSAVQGLSFAQFIAWLDQLAHDPHADARAGAVLDFAPSHPDARRFLNSLGLALERPKADPMRVLAERGLHALAALQRGPAGSPGRPRAETVSAVVVSEIVASRRHWADVVADCWRQSLGDRPSLAAMLVVACRPTFDLPAAYRRTIERIAGRAALRPVDLANQLTAWQHGVSVRCVRAVIAAEGRRTADQVFA